MMGLKLKLAYEILRPPVIAFLKIKFGYKYKKAADLPDNFIVLSNHTTDFDPLFVASSFPGQMYFVASEHITRWKLAYPLLKFFFEPIMRYKGSVAASTVKEVLQKTRAGASVCIFAEGVRSWDGVTQTILPSTGKMVKKARCGLVTYKITGGYFTSPNWSEGKGSTRRGPVYGSPVHVYTKEDLEKMTVDEINEAINRDLYEDAYQHQLQSPQKYKGKRLAERLENLIFLCPKCGSMETLHSQDDTVSCSACDITFKYTQYGMLEGIEQTTVRDLANWQRKEVEKAASENVVYTSENGTLNSIKNHDVSLISQGTITLSADTLKCGDTEIPLSEISDMAIYGRHGLVFTAQKAYYELLPSKTANTIRFLWLFEEYKKRQNI